MLFTEVFKENTIKGTTIVGFIFFPQTKLTSRSKVSLYVEFFKKKNDIKRLKDYARR